MRKGAANDDRRVWFLDGLWPSHHLSEIDELAVIFANSPEPGHSSASATANGRLPAAVFRHL
jgi:hypothetical protein